MQPPYGQKISPTALSGEREIPATLHKSHGPHFSVTATERSFAGLLGCIFVGSRHKKLSGCNASHRQQSPMGSSDKMEN